MNLRSTSRSEEKWLLGRATVAPGGWSCCCTKYCCTCCCAGDLAIVDDLEL